MALIDGVTGDSVTREITLTRFGQTDTQRTTVDRRARTSSLDTNIHGARVSIVADDGCRLTAVRWIAAIVRTEVRVVAIYRRMIDQTDLRLLIASIDGTGVPVVTERGAAREAISGKIAVGQVGW